MIVDRYYYSQLNKAEQIIYKVVYEGIMEHKDIIPIPVRGNFSQETFVKIYKAITKDNPLIYYLNQSVCNMAQDSSGHIAICPQYFFDKDKVKAYNKKIEKTVNELAFQLRLTEGSDYEKARKVHDWLCQNVVYDKRGANLDDSSRVILAHNIIGVFAHRRAQCEGIAKAVKVLLNAVDVKCIVVTGTAFDEKEAEAHAWNIVNLEGMAYHMDVTWDIGKMNKSKNWICYDYFNVSDKMIQIDHEMSEKLPSCRSLKLNYFTANQLIFKSKYQLLSYLKKHLDLDKRTFYFRMEGKSELTELMKEIRVFLQKYTMQDDKNKIKIQHGINENIRTCWINISDDN